MREDLSLLEVFRTGTSSSEAQGRDKIKTPFASPLGGEKATKIKNSIMKKQYSKPAMMVYRMKAQPQLLAGSPQSLPKDDLETEYQW